MPGQASGHSPTPDPDEQVILTERQGPFHPVPTGMLENPGNRRQRWAAGGPPAGLGARRRLQLGWPGMRPDPDPGESGVPDDVEEAHDLSVVHAGLRFMGPDATLR